jgi:hypothetical protein
MVRVLDALSSYKYNFFSRNEETSEKEIRLSLETVSKVSPPEISASGVNEQLELLIVRFHPYLGIYYYIILGLSHKPINQSIIF